MLLKITMHKVSTCKLYANKESYMYKIELFMLDFSLNEKRKGPDML